MPSWSSPYSSARSNCLAFDNSRNAARISAALAIEEPHDIRGAGDPSPGTPRRSLQMERQPRFLHRGQRNSLFFALFFFDNDDRIIVAALHRHDPGFEPAAELRRQDVRPTTHEPTPVARRSQCALTGRRDLQLIVLRYQPPRFQQLL